MRNVPFYYWALFSRSHTCKLRRSWLRPTAEDVSAFGQHTFRDPTNSFPARTNLAPRKKPGNEVAKRRRRIVWGTSLEIPHWWRVMADLVALLIGWSKLSTKNKHYTNQGVVIRHKKFLRWFLKRHFRGKQWKFSSLSNTAVVVFFSKSLLIATKLMLQLERYRPSEQGSLYAGGKLPTHPSPKPTSTLTSHLWQNVGLGEW